MNLNPTHADKANHSRKASHRTRNARLWFALSATVLAVTSSACVLPPPRIGPPSTTVGGTRPTTVQLPTGYTGASPAPLLVLLHGHGSSGADADRYFQLGAVAAARGFIYVHPDGTPDPNRERFWNGTDACCDLFGSGVDDVSYLSGLIREISDKWNVDPRRVFLAGHSNGGFMSYRMACDRASTIAAIVSLNAATFADAARCRPSQPVSVLEVHGDADDAALYAGGTINGVTYPGARATVSMWAAYNGCAPTPQSPAPAPRRIVVDKDPATVLAYGTRCRPGGHAELWTVPAGGHIPALTDTFADQMLDFLLAHPKP